MKVRSRPDSFYANVAASHARYVEYYGTSSGFAPRTAARRRVPVTTVHRWIREARRRGLLGPAGSLACPCCGAPPSAQRRDR